MKNNFYILAMGRSGTTLLQNILDAHPNITIPPEAFFPLHLYHKYKNETIWSNQTIKNFIDDLYTDRPFRIRWNVARKDVENAFIAYKATSYKEACNVVRSAYKSSFKIKKIDCFGDKNPTYANMTKRIMEIDPSAKILHMVRDPRGSGNGRLTTFKMKDALFVGLSWANSNERILKLKEKYPNQYYLVRYENLIEHTEETIKAICQFLEIPFQPIMLSYREETVKEYNQYSTILREKHESVLKPIDKKIADKWKIQLSKQQLADIELTTYKTAKKLGYHFKKPKLSLSIIFRLPVAKFKALLIYTVVSVYFYLPFPIRKFILTIRSYLWDKKYKTD